MRAQLFEHLEAVEVGQLHVQQDQVGPQFACTRNAARAVGFTHDAQALDAAHQLLDEQHVDLVVFDVENSAALRFMQWLERCRGGMDVLRVHRCIGLQRRRGRQDELELGSFAGRARHRNGASHRLGQALDDDQSNARTLDAFTFDAEPVERFEQVRELLGGEAAAGVADEQRHEGLSRTRRECDLALRPVVLDGVGQQVDEHLAQARRVGEHATRCRLQLQMDLVLRRERFDERQRLGENLIQHDGLQVKLEPSRFETGQVERVIDQRQQVFAGRANMAQMRGLLVAQRVVTVLQQLGEPQHRVQRRAQLVAHSRKELRLGAVLALGQQLLLARDLGVAVFRDVPVHADAAHRAAALVAHRNRTRRQPSVAAIGDANPKFIVGGVVRAERGLLRVEHQVRIVGVQQVESLFARRRCIARLDAAQPEHLLVPAFHHRRQVEHPGPDAGQARRKCGALVGAAQGMQGIVLFGHVHHDAGHAAPLRIVQIGRGTQHHPAHAPVTAQGTKLGLERAGAIAQVRLSLVPDALAILRVNALVHPFRHRRRAGGTHQVEQFEHLGVPIGLARGQRDRPQAHARRMRCRAETVGLAADALRILDLRAHVERNAHLRQRRSMGRSFHDAPRQHQAPGAVGAAKPGLTVDRPIRCQRLLGSEYLARHVVAVDVAAKLVQRLPLRSYGDGQDGSGVGAERDPVGLQVVTPDADLCLVELPGQRCGCGSSVVTQCPCHLAKLTRSVREQVQLGAADTAQFDLGIYQCPTQQGAVDRLARGFQLGPGCDEARERAIRFRFQARRIAKARVRPDHPSVGVRHGEHVVALFEQGEQQTGARHRGTTGRCGLAHSRGRNGALPWSTNPRRASTREQVLPRKV